MKRVFGTIGCTAALTLYLCARLPLTALAVLGGVALVATLSLWCFPRFSHRVAARTILLTVVVSVALFVGKTVWVWQPVVDWAGKTVNVTATVTEVDASAENTAYILRVEEGDLPKGTKLRYWQSDAAWQLGETLQGKMEAVDIEKQTDSRLLMLSARADNVFLYAWPAYVGAVHEIEPRGLSPLTAFFADLRASLSANAAAFIGGEQGAVTAAICIGDVSDVSLTTELNFRRSGIAHLLVVSGLHMSLLSLVVSRLLRRRLSARIAASITIAFLLFFMFVVGFSPSVVRAGLMMLIMQSGYLFKRKGDSLNSLGFAFALLSLADPFAVYDIGLQLSFAATLGILLLTPPLTAALHKRLKLDPARRLHRLWSKGVTALAVTLSATVAVAPLSALYFGTLSLVSPISNLLTMWIANAALVLGWITLLIGFLPWIGAPLATALGWLQRLLVDLLLWLAHLFGNLIRAIVPFDHPYLLVWLLGGILLICLGHWLLKGKGRRIAALAVAACLLLSTGAHFGFRFNVTSVQSVAAGSGIVTLLKQNGRCALLLNGTAASWKEALYLLSNEAVTSLDAVYATSEWEQDAYRRLTAEYRVKSAYLLQDGATTTLWNDVTLSVSHGFCRVSVGETDFLFCPSSGDVADLPATWYSNDAVYFIRRAPLSVGRLTAQNGVWLGTADDRERNSATLPWGQYPIALPDGNTADCLQTRGRGDLTRNKT